MISAKNSSNSHNNKPCQRHHVSPSCVSLAPKVHFGNFFLMTLVSSQTWNQWCQWGLLRFWKNVLCHLLTLRRTLKGWDHSKENPGNDIKCFIVGEQSLEPQQKGRVARQSSPGCHWGWMKTRLLSGAAFLFPTFLEFLCSNYLNTSYFVWALGWSPEEVWDGHFSNGQMGSECSKPECMSCRLGF